MRAPQGNGIAEWFMGPLKEQLLWIHDCHDLAQLNTALQRWRERYNEQWIVERHGYRSPAQVRRDWYEPCRWPLEYRQPCVQEIEGGAAVPRPSMPRARRRSMPIDAAHPERYPNGPPQAKRPPRPAASIPMMASRMPPRSSTASPPPRRWPNPSTSRARRMLSKKTISDCWNKVEHVPGFTRAHMGATPTAPPDPEMSAPASLLLARRTGRTACTSNLSRSIGSVTALQPTNIH
ncbi:MAG: integrase core domain-containing protein [Halofilum sp. (in: g-proteobacteria)]|nr:integrase core domain-containing protein [Halofilum sp. (in: g-proteobacteria)]